MKRALELTKTKCTISDALKALNRMGEDRMIGFLDEFITITNVLEEKLFDVTEELNREESFLVRSSFRKMRVISVLNHFFCGEMCKYDAMSALSEVRVPASVQVLLLNHTFTPTCPFPINHLYLGIGHAAYLHVNENIISWDTTDRPLMETIYARTDESDGYNKRYMARFTPPLSEAEFMLRMVSKKLDLITGLIKHKTCSCEVQTAINMVPASAINVVELARLRCVGVHCRVSFRYHPKYNMRPGTISLSFFPTLTTIDTVHHHANPTSADDTMGRFLCYPSLSSTDYISIGREANALLCSRLECPTFTFRSIFESDDGLGVAYNNIFPIILDYLRILYRENAFEFKTWWATKVITCEDIKLFYFLFSRMIFSSSNLSLDDTKEMKFLCTNQRSGCSTL